MELNLDYPYNNIVLRYHMAFTLGFHMLCFYLLLGFYVSHIIGVNIIFFNSHTLVF